MFVTIILSQQCYDVLTSLPQETGPIESYRTYDNGGQVTTQVSPELEGNVQCVIRGCYEDVDNDFDIYSIGPVTVNCVSSKWLRYGHKIYTGMLEQKESDMKFVRVIGGRVRQGRGDRGSDTQTDRQKDKQTDRVDRWGQL